MSASIHNCERLFVKLKDATYDGRGRRSRNSWLKKDGWVIGSSNSRDNFA